MNVKDILKASKYRVYNVALAKKLGIPQTILLMELADAEDYFLDGFGKLVPEGANGWFFTTYDNIADNTALTDYAIRKGVKDLKEAGLIEVAMKGVPAKQFYKLNVNTLEKLLYSRSSPPELEEASPPESDTSSPPESDRTIYKEPINKKPIRKEELNSSANIIRKAYIKSFSDKYQEVFGTKFMWDGKQIKQLSLLIAKIQKSYKDTGLINPSTDQQVGAFEVIMDRALNKDNWYRNNFEPAILNSKFNILKVKPNGTTKSAVESLRSKYITEAGLT